MIAHQMVNEQMAGKNPQAKLPYWKRGAMNKETMAEMQAFQAERTALIESVLGPDAKTSLSMDPAFRNQRFGNLADDKIDAIGQIEQDYNNLMSQRMIGANPAEMSKRMQERELLEKEKRADIAALLSPDELEQYELRTSRSANQMMHQLRNVEVSEDEFKSLYRLQKAIDDAYPQGPGMNQETMAARMAAQRELTQQVRGVLGDERYYQYLEGSDHNFAMAKGFVEKYPSLPSSVTLQLYDLQNQVQTSMMGGARLSQEERFGRMQGFNQQLESILGAEVAAEYRKQGQGRMFTIPGSGGMNQAIRLDGR
jgi:hypothetical protein